MPTSREIREFNQDIRICIRKALKELNIHSNRYGLLWCDEFGGFDQKKNTYNTNLHAHGVYVGPYIPQPLLVKLWTDLRAEKDGARSFHFYQIYYLPVYILDHTVFSFWCTVNSLSSTPGDTSRSDWQTPARIIAFHWLAGPHDGAFLPCRHALSVTVLSL